MPNEHFLNRQNGDTEKRITDTCFAMESDMDKLFHLECQINPDGSFLIRTFEYDAQIGLDNGTLEYENIRKKMVEFMVGPILEYRAKTLYNRGIPQGFQRGKEECLRELIHAGILKQDEAANYLGMTRDEFRKIFTEEK